jgi:hypothetical protein
VCLDEILNGRDGIEYYLDYILLKPIASTIPKWRTFKLLRCVQLLNRFVYLDEILYEGDGIDADLDIILIKIPYIQPFENGGRLNF